MEDSSKYVVHNGVKIRYLIDEDNDNIIVNQDDVVNAFWNGITIGEFLSTDTGLDIISEYRRVTGREFKITRGGVSR